MRFTFEQLKELLRRNGGQALSDYVLNVLAAIGLAESGGDPTVRRNCPTGATGYCYITRNNRIFTERPVPGQGREDSIGLWQINTTAHGGNFSVWSDVNANARKAVELAKTSQGLRHWGSYTNGSYKKYIGGSSSNNSASVTFPDVPSSPISFDTNVQVIGSQNRYMIAFIILVIIFIFAFN